MADAKKPDEPKPDSEAANPPETDAEMTDEQLKKVAGGLAAQRFDSMRIRPISTN